MNAENPVDDTATVEYFYLFVFLAVGNGVRHRIEAAGTWAFDVNKSRSERYIEVRNYLITDGTFDESETAIVIHHEIERNDS